MGSWKLGKIAGIDITLHWTLILLVGWVALSAPAGGVVGNVAFVTALFACVLLHELGHALAARQFGVGTSGITLLPIGGIATLERMPRRPLQELWIAVAGPLVNVAIAATLFALMGPIGYLAATGTLSVKFAAWAQYLMFANIGLVVFNMLPAFPMDGGRVLRAILAFRLPYVSATQLAAKVGKFVAVGLGLLGIVSGNFMLILVAGFVALAGTAEARMVAWEHRQATAGHAHPPGSSWSPKTEVTGSAWQRPVVVWDAAERRYRVVA